MQLADRTYVINLDRRPDRLRTFTARAAETSELAGWVRFSAVDGWEMPGPRSWPVPADEPGLVDEIGPGMNGCRPSHMAVLAEATDVIDAATRTVKAAIAHAR